ncbi:hypothetical protein OH76DRAFT_1557072 [Lentinus brumalis]|uniref:Uncharacterized protein n=1 Tax=Lentinus brumalis TaxID=2498619 RepID=A0A371D7L0_9APHY|nr:hypothetical protein OH76DRAFT_1557072 [Polyporus brumalis]
MDVMRRKLMMSSQRSHRSPGDLTEASATDSPATTSSSSLYLDDLVAARRDDWPKLLVTSPNVTYIPKIMDGHVSLCMLSDGTYGPLDPTCWPQICDCEFAYFAAVQKIVPPDHRHSALWRRPTSNDVWPLEDNPAHGYLTEDFMAPLAKLTKELTSKVRAHISLDPSPPHAHLRFHEKVVVDICKFMPMNASTLRDHEVQLGIFRRHWLLAMAYMLYCDMTFASYEASSEPLPVRTDLMGAWTSDPEAVIQLYKRGIPVWYVRKSFRGESPGTSTGREVPFTPPPKVYPAPISGKSLYEGPVGSGSLRATVRFGTFLDDSYHDLKTYRNFEAMAMADLRDPLWPASSLLSQLQINPRRHTVDFGFGAVLQSW